MGLPEKFEVWTAKHDGKWYAFCRMTQDGKIETGRDGPFHNEKEADHCAQAVLQSIKENYKAVGIVQQSIN